MKKYTQRLAVSLTVVCCCCLSTAFSQNTDVVFSGKIPGYKPALEHNYIITQAFPEKQYPRIFTRIHDDGAFNILVPLEKQGQINLLYHGHRFMLLARPGDRIALELDASRTTARISGGTYANTNRLIQQYTAALNSCTNDNTLDQNMSSDSFLLARMAALHREEHLIDSLLGRDGAIDTLCRNFLYARARHSAASELVITPFYKPYNRAVHDTSAYFRQVADMAARPLLLDGATEMYSVLLRNMDNMWYAIVSLGNAYNEERKSWNTDKAACYKQYVQGFYQRRRLADETLRRHMLTGLWLRAQNCPDFIAAYKDSIGPLTAAMMPPAAAATAETDVFSLIRAFEAPDSVKQQLTALFNSLLGQPRVLYHWSVTCGNSTPGLATAQQLQDATTPETVVFLGSDMTPEQYAAALPEYPQLRLHRHLSHAERIFFEQFFGMTGLPHASLIDAKGRVAKASYNFYWVENAVKDLKGL